MCPSITSRVPFWPPDMHLFQNISQNRGKCAATKNECPIKPSFAFPLPPHTAWVKPIFQPILAVFGTIGPFGPFLGGPKKTWFQNISEWSKSKQNKLFVDLKIKPSEYPVKLPELWPIFFVCMARNMVHFGIKAFFNDPPSSEARKSGMAGKKGADWSPSPPRGHGMELGVETSTKRTSETSKTWNLKCPKKNFQLCKKK